MVSKVILPRNTLDEIYQIEQEKHFHGFTSLFEHYNRKSLDNLFQNYRRDVKKQDSKGIAFIPLGYMDKEFSTSMYGFDYAGGRKNLLMSGGVPGFGKTVLLGNILLDGFHRRLPKNHILIFDSKPEFHYRKTTSTNKDHLSFLSKFKLSPRGYDKLEQVAPIFLRDRPNVDADHFVQYDTSNLTMTDIETLFGYHSKATGEAISNKKNLLENAVKGFKDKRIEADAGSLQESLTMRKRPHLKSSDILMMYERGELGGADIKRKFRNMISRGVLGQGRESIDVIRLLKQGRIVDYCTSMIAGSDDQVYSMAYMGAELRKVLEGRLIGDSIRENDDLDGDEFEVRDRRALYEPVVIGLTEYNTVFPRIGRPSTKIILNDIYNQYRFKSISTIADSPNFYEVDKKAMEHSTVLAFRPLGKDLRYLRETKDLSSLHFEQLRTLRGEKFEPGRVTEPCQVAVIPENPDPDVEFDVFIPLPPLSNIQVEV